MLALDLDRFALAARWDQLPNGLDLVAVAETAKDPAFPGAILPAVDAQGALYWYGVATTGAEWRLLQPLLLAYVGPTVTLFSGQPTELRPQVAMEELLLQAGVHAAAQLVSGPDCTQLAARALARLRKAMSLRPSGVSAAPLPTPQLLARLEMCLAVGDREAAEGYLAVLRGELRLDTLNVHYLEVRILSTFRAWKELVDKEWFPSLAVARKPSAVATSMLEALWHTRLSPFSDDPAEQQRQYRESVQAAARPLLGQVSAATTGLVAEFIRLEGVAPSIPQASGPAAHELLEDAAEAPSLARNSDARAAVAALDPQERGILLDSAAGQRALTEVQAAGELAPANWNEWLNVLGDARFTSAALAAAAREGVTAWPVTTVTTQEEARSIAEALVDIGLSSDQRRDRLIESIPTLIHWVKTDPAYPRTAMREIYVALMQVFGLFDARGAPERDAAVDLLDACLALGVTASLYRQLLADFRALIDPGAGQSSIYWLIDLAAILLEHSSPDANARLELLNRVLASFQSFLKLLTPGQRTAYNLVAITASWPPLPAAQESAKSDGLATLGSKSIAIYTLTESAARQAAVAIREEAPTAKVELAHDHVASPRLVRLARDVDVFIVAAASAKHAATDCIQSHRGGRTLLYAPGRGFCGILRVLEEHLARGDSVSTVR
jgi:hypothetical protein